MEIMKSFTKRKNEFIKKVMIRSTFLMASAFAVLTPESVFAKPHEIQKAPADSVATAKDIFSKLHCSALEILPLSTRLDMLDYWAVDSVYKASNAMEGLSWLEKVSDNYLKVRVTSVSTLEIKILPIKNGHLILTINTLGDDVQAQDSHVKFYDMNLFELPTDKHFVMPEVKDFFEIPKGSATKMKEIEEMIPFPTIALSANPDNDNLKAWLTVEKYINEDDWNIAKLFLKPSIVLNWKKEKYKY